MTMSKQAITNWKKLSDQLRKFNEYVHYENLKIGIDDNYEVSFRDTNSYLWKEEEYKSEIAVNGRKMLSSHKWDESWIGTGKIAKCVIDAMDHSGNLVQYNQKINFENRFNPEHETFQPDAERVIFELFRGTDDEAAFNAAIKTFGAKYDTVAYLFYIKDSARFLPIRSRHFDQCFSELGIDYSTEGKCSYENYCGFLEIVGEIRDYMEENLPMKSAPELIDAHSFVWIMHEGQYKTWSSPNAKTSKSEVEQYREHQKKKQRKRDEQYPKDYVSEIPLTKEDWKELLRDQAVFSANDIGLLKKFYLADNHALTCVELASREGTNPSSYISPVVGLAKRITKAKNLDPIYGEEDRRVWWRVPFWGKYKDDNHFEWKLRPELADALAELYPNLDFEEFENEEDNKYIDDINRDTFSDVNEDFEYSGIPQKKKASVLSKGRPTPPRSRRVAKNALAHADYRCEIDGDHFTFTRKNSDKPYTEPHHLIPLSMQDVFEYSLDVEENVVSLCSNCHNWIHLGQGAEELIRQLYDERIEHLRKVKLDISIDDLLKMYGI